MSNDNNKSKDNGKETEGKEQPGLINGIDLNAIRLSANYEEAAGVQKLLLTVPVKKPTRTEFFRVHPDPAFRINVGVIELREENETYLVSGQLTPLLPNEVVPKSIVTCINRQGVLFLWPIRLPGPDGRLDTWNTSANRIAEMATTRWLRMIANRGLGAYDVHEATSIGIQPQWPEKTFGELLDIAFRERYITTDDHPVLRQLRGEV